MRLPHFDDLRSHESAVCFMHIAWVSLAVGAIPAALVRGIGLAPQSATTGVIRTGVGLFTLQLAESWPALFVCTGSVTQLAAYNAANATFVEIALDSVNVNAAPLVNVRTVNGAGALTDPAVGDIVRVNLQLQAMRAGY